MTVMTEWLPFVVLQKARSLNEMGHVGQDFNQRLEVVMERMEAKKKEKKAKQE